MTREAAPKSFFDEVKASVTRFAQSAVVIDDEAYMVVYPNEKKLKAPTHLNSAEGGLKAASGATEPSSERTAASPLNAPDDDFITSPEATEPRSKSEEVEKEASQAADHSEGHSLDARRIISAFAERGIICGVINPDQGDDFVSSTYKVVQKADFIVLDYKIHSSYDASLNFLEKVATEDVKNNRQRAMIIYTGEDGIDEVIGQVRKKLESLPLGQPVVSVEKHANAMKVGSLVIDVVRKSKPEEDFVEQEGGRLAEDRVPDYLIGLYADLANGLLQAAVLEDLAIIREQMPRLANLFSADMDAAYLAHRALVDKDDAPGIVTTNLATAIENLLGSEEAQHKLGKTLVEAWIAEKLQDKPHLSLPVDKAKAINFNSELLMSLVEEGLKHTTITFNDAESTEVDEKQKALIAPRITEIFTGNAEVARLSNARFAMTTSLSKRNDSSYVFDAKSSPFLQLGCIIEDLAATQDPRYFLCIQPVCNSVRLPSTKATQFPFMPFQTVTPKRADKPLSAFDLVVPDRTGKPDYLRAVLKPAAIKMFEFKAASEGKVVSTSHADGIIFLSASTPAKSWRWVAQLKPAHAQRLVHQFATNLSRVGLDESEWLRQSAQSSWQLN